MQMLTEVLEVDINRKSTPAIRLSSLNFVDSASLLCWFDMRRMVFNTGKRFLIRLEGDILGFILYMVICATFIFLKVNGISDFKPFLSDFHYFQIGFTLFIYGIYCARALWSAAYINEETEYSVNKLTTLRHLIQRMVDDKRILSEDFISLSRDIRKAKVFINFQA